MSIYSLFTCESLWELHLGVFKLLKRYAVSYCLPKVFGLKACRKVKNLARIRAQTLRGCNLLLSSMEGDRSCQELIYTFRRRSPKRTGRDIYKSYVRGEIEMEALPECSTKRLNLQQSSSIRVQKREDSTLGKGANELQQNVCWFDGRRRAAGMEQIGAR